MKKMLLSFVVCFYASMSVFGQVDTFEFLKNYPSLEIDGEYVCAELAEKHISQGRFYLYTGERLSTVPYECKLFAEEKLGVTCLSSGGCIVIWNNLKQSNEYNAVMNAVIEQMFFGDFWELYEKELNKCSEMKKLNPPIKVNAG